MASTAAPPDSAEMLNPAPPHPVVILEIFTDSQPGVDDEDDDTPMFPNRYVDIDNKAIGSVFRVQAANIKILKVTSNNADKYANNSCQFEFLA